PRLVDVRPRPALALFRPSLAPPPVGVSARRAPPATQQPPSPTAPQAPPSRATAAPTAPGVQAPRRDERPLVRHIGTASGRCVARPPRRSGVRAASPGTSGKWRLGHGVHRADAAPAALALRSEERR